MKKREAKTLDAFALFPELMQKSKVVIKSEERRKALSKFGRARNKGSSSLNSAVAPPQPPNVGWLSSGVFEDLDQVGDTPVALVLIEEQALLGPVSTGLEDLGYQVEFAETPVDAIRKIGSSNVTVVVMHSKFESEVSLAQSMVHRYMSRLNMDKRRMMFYILVDPEVKTLYELEALSLSVNLVINDLDIRYLREIFKKSFADYRRLVDPFLESLSYNRMR